jgi:XTP/dITP diphosphohydrolase
MMEIVLATRNSDKVREIRRILPGIGFLSLKDFPQVPEIEENGETLEENAILKAQEVAVRTGKLALADDSGLEVEALGGRPGVRSSRFAGEGVSYEENNKKLLLLMSGKRRRGARFRCVVALAGPGMETIVREGVCRGRIARSPRGKRGFGYDPVFIVSGPGKTFAELSASVKNDISHRARALRKLGRDLSRIERKL